MANCCPATRRVIHSHQRSLFRFSIKSSTAQTSLSPSNSNWKCQGNEDIISLCRDGRLKQALGILEGKTSVDFNAYSSLLQACTDTRALIQGKRVHAHMLRNGYEQNVCLGTKLVSMYAMCQSLENARQVFDKIYKPNVFLWNAMIRGYVRNGFCEESFQLYHSMEQTGIEPDNFTFALVLKACAALLDLKEGREIHHHISRSGFESDVSVGNSLVAMYIKCGSIEEGRRVFDEMSERNEISWNTMIAGYCQNGRSEEALALFHQMQLEGVIPNSATMVTVLPVCARWANLQQGKWIHAYIISFGFESDVSVVTALIDMYAKCGQIEVARQLFDNISARDVVLWNAMIAGYVCNEFSNEAVSLFHQMRLADVIPNATTMLSVLTACAHLGALQQGKWFHHYIVRNGFVSDISVQTALLSMYANCGSIVIARQLFDKICKRDIVSWNAMIIAYVQNGYANKALTLFNQMLLASVKPNLVTLVSVLPACAQLASLQQGKCIHAYIFRNRCESDVSLQNSLVDMYAKCGRIEIARQVFEKIDRRDVVSWSVMIAGYGLHGYGKDALNLFLCMQQVGMKPNHITFVGVLSACSHAGLVDEGWQYFKSMSQQYCINPRVEHYACMVDLLGRAGHLDEAKNFIEKMSIKPDVGVWGALLGACKIHGNIELGQYVLEQLLELEPRNAGNYISLSNIYAAAAKWDDVAKVKTMLKEREVKSQPGCSWIEIKNRVYTFFVGDR